jgi:hypothetical protein
MAVFPKVLGGADNNVHSVDTSLNGLLGVTDVASNVSQNLGLEAEAGNSLAVLERLLRGNGRGKLDIVDSEGIEGLGNLDLGLGVKVGIGELFTLCFTA